MSTAPSGITLNRIGGFNPQQVPNLAIWLDASDTATINPSNTSTNITSWGNKGSFASSAVKNGANSSPTTLSNTLNGLNVLAFANLNSLIYNTTFTSQAKAMFFVAKITSELNNNTGLLYRFFNPFSGYTSGYFNSSVNYDTTTSKYYFGAGVNNGAAKVQCEITNPKDIPTVYCLFNSATQANNVITLNGTSQTLSTTAGASGYTLSPALDYRIQQENYNTAGDYAELLIYDGEINATQRQQIEGYLAWKWGLNGSLPSDHPYKNINIYAQPQIPTVLNPLTVPLSLSLNINVFSPTLLPGCVLWLDGADSSTLPKSGGNITQWNDKSPSGSIFTAYNNPTETFLNGLPTVELGSTGYFENTSYSLPITYSVFAIGYSRKTTGFTGFITATPDVIFQIRSENNAMVVFKGGGVSPWGTNAGTYPPITDNTIWSAINPTASGTLTLYQNGTAVNTNSGVTNIASTGLQIGVWANSSYTWQGIISEVIIYNRGLSTLEQQRVEAYLAWKWGVIANIPTANPYKNAYAMISSGIWQSYPPTTLPLQMAYNQFNPKQISNMLLWFDASDQSSFTKNVSNQLTAITDKSGAGATDITFDSSTVTWSATALNGYPAFDMSSGGSAAGHFRGTLGTSMTNFFTHTAFIVTWLTGAQADRGYPCLAFAGAATGAVTNYRALDTDQSPGNNVFRTVAFFGGGTGTIEVATRQTVSPFVYSESYSSTTDLINGYYNGGGLNTASRADPGSTASHFFVACGSDTTNYNVNTWNGLISEIIVYNSTLSEPDIKRVEGYLAWKWGLQANLAPYHPFKAYAPPP